MDLRRRLIIAAPMLALGSRILPAFAASQAPVVIELFTSQGCSSCPPADKLLAGLSGQTGLITLAWHVDYWDYIGWKDTLGLPEATARQKAYALSLGTRRLVTPQFIVNGATEMSGGNGATLKALIAGEQARPVRVTLERAAGRLGITLAGPAGLDGVIEIVRRRRQSSVEILRGENRGRSITYADAVTALSQAGVYAGGTATFDLPDPAGDDPGTDAVVLVRAGRSSSQPGRILGAGAA